jgi:hypothetical protein
MQLHLLAATACLSIYYDTNYELLFLDWAGELTLPAVQEACVAVAQCYLQRAYSHVLSSNLQVTAVGQRVSTWLGMELLPYITVAGVQQLAWVSAPALVSRDQAQEVVNRVPSVGLNLFDNTEEAVAWLQQTRFSASGGAAVPPRSTATQFRLSQGMQVIKQEVQLIQQEVQQLQQKVGKRPLKAARA